MIAVQRLRPDVVFLNRLLRLSDRSLRRDSLSYVPILRSSQVRPRAGSQDTGGRGSASQATQYLGALGPIFRFVDQAAVAQRLQVPQPAFYASCVGRRGGTAHDVGVGTQPLGHSLPQFGEAWRISADGPARPPQADANPQHQDRKNRGKANV